MYLSTSDYVQHKYEPGDEAANRFYAAVDRSLAAIDAAGATLVVTADHGMRAKADETGVPRAIYLQEIVDEWLGAGAARVVLPITDPYVLHHGWRWDRARWCISHRQPMRTPGESPACQRRSPCRAIRHARISSYPRIMRRHRRVSDSRRYRTRPADHDLSALDAPLRSRQRSEQLVPLLANRAIDCRRAANYGTSTPSTSRSTGAGRPEGRPLRA